MGRRRACARRSTRRSPPTRPVGAPATWVLSNHDVTRPVTRYGRDDSSFAFAPQAVRDARRTSSSAGAGRGPPRLLTAALPGSLYIYQGDELGLDEVEVPLDEIQDPMHARSGGIDPGRDGCRVPLPWSGDEPPFGFSPADAIGAAVAQPAGPLGGLTVEAAGIATRTPCSTCTGRPSASGAPNPASATAR